MKHLIKCPLHLVISISIFSGLSVYAEPDAESTAKVSGLLREQFDKEQSKLKGLETDGKKKLADLATLKSKVVQDSVALSQRESAGYAQFLSYINLLKVRYSDRIDEKDGKFVESAELNADDVKNINQLFSTYLNRTPLSGRVSAGLASELLDKGRDALEEAVSKHRSPNADNNSDLAIIAKNVEDTEHELKIVAELESKLRAGVKIENIAASSSTPQNRAPASSTAPNSVPAAQR